jgi:peptidoglycan/LPS O-acetylase OafA/YrhL
VNARAGRFPLVDSLRAIAALAVLGTHAAFFAGAYGPGSAIGPYAQRLDVGVTIFFVISGFLLYRPFVKARMSGERPPATGPYAWRRFLRIVPAYWVALTVTAVSLGTAGVFTPSGIPTFYGLAQTYRESTISGGLTQAWTLSIELAFYAFLPLYALALRRLVPGRGVRTEAAGLVALVAASEVWKVAVLAGGDPEQVHISPALLALPAWWDHFAIGMGLAVLTVWIERRGRPPRWVAALDRFPTGAWLVAALAFWAVSTHIGIGDEFFGPVSNRQYLLRAGLYGVIALGLVLPAVVGDPTRGLPRRVLGWRVLGWLGLVSYGIYLWHDAVLEQLARWDFGSVTIVHPYAQWPLAGLAGATLLAAVSYYAVERPALGLKRLAGRRDPSPGEAIAEPAPVMSPAPGEG